MLFKVGAARELGLECGGWGECPAKLPIREGGFIDTRRVDALLPVIVHHTTSTRSRYSLT
jgi:hypothetical protein